MGLSERSITSREKLGLPTHRRLTFSEIWTDEAKGTLGKFGFGKAAEYFNDAESFDADGDVFYGVSALIKGEIVWNNRTLDRWDKKKALKVQKEWLESGEYDDVHIYQYRDYGDGYAGDSLYADKGKVYGAESFDAESMAVFQKGGHWVCMNCGDEYETESEAIECAEQDGGVLDGFEQTRKEMIGLYGAESKCACGCSIGKCGCDEGCKCGCNHKKGGAKWAQAESFGAEMYVFRDGLNCGIIGTPTQFERRYGSSNIKEIKKIIKERDDLERVPSLIKFKLQPKTLKRILSRKTPLDVDFNWKHQWNSKFDAESFEAEVCPCGCAMKGCVCSSSCKGECLGAESFAATGVCNCGSSCNCDCGCAESGVCNCGPSCPCNCGCGIGAESFGAESFNDLDYESEQWS